MIWCCRQKVICQIYFLNYEIIWARRFIAQLKTELEYRDDTPFTTILEVHQSETFEEIQKVLKENWYNITIIDEKSNLETINQMYEIISQAEARQRDPSTLETSGKVAFILNWLKDPWINNNTWIINFSPESYLFMKEKYNN